MRGVLAAFAIAAALALATGVSYADPSGHTSEEQILGSGAPIFPGSSFETVAEGAGQPRVVRTLPGSSALAGRGQRRRSLAYFAQLTDFQLADEESPARVEFTDRGANAAFRPQEAFHPWAIDWSFRQLDNFTSASPIAGAGGARAPMDLALLTGDHADNQQLNEAEWVRKLIDGGSTLDPNSGVKSDYSQCTVPERTELQARETAGQIPNEPTYMGVQDYDDLGYKAPDYYDPDEPFGDQYGTFPKWPGLMDRAQQPFTPVGLRRGTTPVPTYVSNGNHDQLVQGNEDAVRAFEDIATGCFKVAQSTSTLPIGTQPDPNQLFSPGIGFAVRPDERRQFIDRVQLKRVYSEGGQADDHGFAFVDPTELAASGYSASYWAHDLKPGIRFISLDTVSEGGVVQESADGNIDDPQFRWLQRELDRAQAAGKLVIVFGHHPIRSLTADPPDEAASPCAGHYDASGNYSAPDEHGHDPNPGCDLDPRSSSPIHQGDDLRSLLSAHHNVIAYVAGHTHENKVLACGSTDGCDGGGNWWEINTSAIADWPEQSRLIQVMDNRDGTLSIFGTLTNTAAPVGVPASGASASGFSDTQMASISRAVTMNDPQLGDGTAEGAARDQNVELMVDDPRRATIRGTSGNDVISGTSGRDVILCGAGDDVVRTGAGNDFIRCGPGDDFVSSGRGRDRVSGGPGRDRLYGGPGRDRLFGRRGADRLYGQGGTDLTAGGPGADRLFGGPRGDWLFGGAQRDRLFGGRGNDAMFGGPGRDRLVGGPGRDRRRQ